MLHQGFVVPKLSYETQTINVLRNTVDLKLPFRVFIYLEGKLSWASHTLHQKD